MKVLTRSSWRAAWLLVPACICGLAGCGPAAPKIGELAPVSGHVKFKGQPLERALVMFTPKSGTPGTGAYGTTDASGEYELIHKTQKSGIEPGQYQVTITRMSMKDGSPIPDGKSAADVEAVQVIPAPYSDPNAESPLTTVTVPEAGKNFDFDIPG